MKKSNFTVVLPSNSNPEIFPNNSSSKFSVEFDNPIYLSGQYEVALIEIAYKNDIMALRNNSFQIFALKSKDNLFCLMNNASPLIWNFNSIELKPMEMEEETGYDPDYISWLFSKIKEFAAISIDERGSDLVKNKVYIKMLKDNVLLVISKGLAKMLNYTRTSFSTRFNRYGWGMQRKQYVKDWNVSLVPLYALKYERIILKKKGEAITFEEFVKRWKKKISSKYIEFTVTTPSGSEEGYREIKIRKLTPLKGKDWCVFEIEDDLSKEVFDDGHPFLANMFDELSYSMMTNDFEKYKRTVWAVRIYNNNLNAGFASNEEYSIDEITMNLEKIESVSNLLDVLNVKSEKYQYRFSYDSSSNRMSVTVPPFHRIKLDDVLQSVLGFFGQESLYSKTNIATRPPLLKRNVYNLFVYCNIIDFIHVGNVEAPMIRQFPISSHTDVLINREFYNKIYIPVNRNVLDRIDVSIHDQAGALVPFKDGITILTLEFRAIDV